MARVLSEAEFEEFVRPLLGLEVSLAWKGYGSAIFLELGRLSPPQGCRRHGNGEACLTIEWDWRVESPSSVLFGSSNNGPEIESGIRGLQGFRTHEISTIGNIPELVAAFSNGQCLRSMVMASGDPQWGIRLPSGAWLSAKDGARWLDAEPAGITDAEASAWKLSEDTRDRWGIPRAEPVAGECAGCDWLLRVDGDACFLDYGVCIAATSPFDGRIVHMSSGCPVFTAALGSG